jgi:hypothetical protein
MPGQVHRSLAGKSSTGTTKVVVPGPTLSKKKATL